LHLGVKKSNKFELMGLFYTSKGENFQYLCPNMEDWQLDFEWTRVLHIVKKAMGKDSAPDLNIVLILIGIQELGHYKKGFSKEEKQDLMHIAVCTLLLYDGYYEFVGRDDDGWPHFKQVIELPNKGTFDQERMLKINAVRYFKDLETDNGGFQELE
jgi:hypothetical protein